MGNAEVMIPLVCIGVFFLVIIILLVRFFFTMVNPSAKNQEKQNKLYKSRFLKKAAKYHASTPDFLFPNTNGSSTWKSWLKK